MNYAYNEEKMLESIAAMRGKPGRPRLLKGCRIHGNINMRTRINGWKTCRICQAAHSRSNYAKHADQIKAQKREYYRRNKAA